MSDEIFNVSIFLSFFFYFSVSGNILIAFGVFNKLFNFANGQLVCNIDSFAGSGVAGNTGDGGDALSATIGTADFSYPVSTFSDTSGMCSLSTQETST